MADIMILRGGGTRHKQGTRSRKWAKPMAQVYIQRIAAAGVAFLGVQIFDCSCLASPSAGVVRACTAQGQTTHPCPPSPPQTLLLTGARGQRSAVLFQKERDAAGSSANGSMNLQDWLSARNDLKGATAPLLSVTNFSLENIEVGEATPATPHPPFYSPQSHSAPPPHSPQHAGREGALKHAVIALTRAISGPSLPAGAHRATTPVYRRGHTPTTCIALFRPNP